VGWRQEIERGGTAAGAGGWLVVVSMAKVRSQLAVRGRPFIRNHSCQLPSQFAESVY